MSSEGRAAAMEQALVEHVPGALLSERVANALTRNHGVVALRAVRAEVAALGGEALALRFWRLAGAYLNGVAQDEAAKLVLVADVKALEPAPVHRGESTWHNIVA